MQMNKSKDRSAFGLYTVLIVLSTLFFSSCQLTTPYLASQGPVTQSAEANDIVIECTYLSPVEIEKMHGISANPFIAPVLSITPQKMLVFEIKISNNDSAPLKLDIRDINFFFDNKAYRPMSTSQMEKKIEEYADPGNRVKERRTARTFMFENIDTIDGNAVKTKYLVFMGNMKDKGEGELDIPFKTEGGLEAGEFSFKYNFKLTK